MFTGAKQQPGMRAGNIPGSLNVPFMAFVNPDGTMKSNDDLAKVMAAQGVDLGKKETLNTCGSGVTACVIDLALKLLGS